MEQTTETKNEIRIHALANWQTNAGVGLETGNISGAGGNNNNGSDDCQV
jgi:hypothetical protein